MPSNYPPGVGERGDAPRKYTDATCQRRIDAWTREIVRLSGFLSENDPDSELVQRFWLAVMHRQEWRERLLDAYVMEHTP